MRAMLAGILSVGVLLGAVGQEKPPKTVKDVMNVAHKGKETMLNKITGGKGTEEDHKTLVRYYELVAASKPTHGDEKSWKEKTGALLAAAKGVLEKKEGAIEKLKTASNCKACHSVHKPPN